MNMAWAFICRESWHEKLSKQNTNWLFHQQANFNESLLDGHSSKQSGCFSLSIQQLNQKNHVIECGMLFNPFGNSLSGAFIPKLNPSDSFEWF